MCISVNHHWGTERQHIRAIVIYVVDKRYTCDIVYADATTIHFTGSNLRC